MTKDIETLYLYLDGELNAEDTRVFEEKLKNNPDLQKEFEFSRNLGSQISESLRQELLRQNPHAEEVDFWVSIKDQILQHHDHTTSSAFFPKIKAFFEIPSFSPAVYAGAFVLVFAFYIGQKAEQYISQDVAVVAKAPVVKSEVKQERVSDVVNLNELNFVTSQQAPKNYTPRKRSFRSLPPQKLESRSPDCFIKLRTPHLGRSPKEPLEFGREKQVNFKGTDGTLQDLRLKALSFKNDRLEMQINWFNKDGENLLSENVLMPNGGRFQFEAGDKPEAQTRVILAARCG